MKRYINSIISIVILITLLSAAQKNSAGERLLILQSTDNEATPASLIQSADIISARLKLYGVAKFDVSVVRDKDQIAVQLYGDTDVTEIGRLLTHKGDLAFYETFSKEEISELLKPDNRLNELLSHDYKSSSSDPRVGCTSYGKLKEVNTYLVNMKTIINCKFSWGVNSENSSFCLFALKTGTAGKPLLTKSDIMEVKAIDSKEPGNIMAQIRLTSSASSIFAEATKTNLDKSIAIVIDDQVYSWPVVRSVITGGKIEVSGNLTNKDVNYFIALADTESLPLNFSILK